MQKTIMLSDLLGGMDGILDPPMVDVPVSGVTMDSRQVQPGFLFAAARGGERDGHTFIPDAIRKGAVAIVGERSKDELFRSNQLPAVMGGAYLHVQDSRRALAYLAAAMQGFPARRLTMIGVTGTDGKTTTSNLLYHILQSAGYKTGMISTVNAVIGDQVLDTGFHVTTPDAISIQAYLSQMVSAGLTHVVLEATSHGLAQSRVASCDFDMALVTNITHEHLDYHGTYEAYREAKGLLFSGLEHTASKPFHPPHGAVINRDDGSYEYLRLATHVPVLSYGLTRAADVTAGQVEMSKSGLSFTVTGHDLAGEIFGFPVRSHLIGEFNLYNCLAAAVLARGLMRLDEGAISAGIQSLRAVPGRMEAIDLGQSFTAMVDFAHTPNALRRALQAARRLSEGRVIAVFGSAGLRDRAKRAWMAQVSAELADLTVLTAEDPRSETLADILDEMAHGAVAGGGTEGVTFWRLPDRREALRFAVRLARPGDLVIACGKGHEQSMCFGETEYPWDDRIALRAALAEHLGVPGPQMPYLPTGSDDRRGG
jgi:UDP-N-acetylmuramoyl-L-alanyl-D-glutamate--2,6-diaminopimelate ligase